MTMKPRCEAEVLDGWHVRRCSHAAKHTRGTMAVCGIHNRKRSVRPYTGCQCSIHDRKNA